MKAFLLFACFAIAAQAEDLTLTDGTVYKDVTVTKVEPDGLSIRHAIGLAKVPFVKLTKEQREKHGYDEAKAKAYAAAQAAKLRDAERSIDKDLSAMAEAQFANLPPEKRYEVSKARSRRVTLEYIDKYSAQTRVVERLERELAGKAEIEAERQMVPKGGYFVVNIETGNIESANTKHFVIIVTDESGKQLLKERGESEIADPSGGSWLGTMVVAFDKPMPKSVTVRVVDNFEADHHDFTVRRLR